MKKKPAKKRVAKSKTVRAKVKKAAVSTEPETTLVLRTCPADMIAKSPPGSGVTWSFQWPRQGPVECPDWDPTPRCGHGLHGLEWGEGDWSFLNQADDAVWMVVEVATRDLVRLTDNGQIKVKFPRGNVVFAGSKVDAMIRVMCGSEAMGRAQKAAAAWGKKIGNFSKAASSGNFSKAASSGNFSKAASSGDSSTAASSGDFSTAASSGNSGIAATIGSGGHAKAGPNGLVIVTYWVDAEKRYRACVGNVGEDGIEADVWYRVVDAKLVRAERGES